ncbi:hypothetical protein ACFQZ4_53590 [Catellatospora coxensis]
MRRRRTRWEVRFATEGLGGDDRATTPSMFLCDGAAEMPTP